MTPTDFSKYIQNFLSRYLPGEKGASANTIDSYRYTFILFIEFMEQKKKINVKKLWLNSITKENVVEFLNWLQIERKCSSSTRNTRLAAIHSFFQYLQYESVENLNECQRILPLWLLNQIYLPILSVAALVWGLSR
jgi:site-specific recombinase XerD